MKTNSIKKSLPRLALLMTILFLLLIIPINIVVQLNLQHQNQFESSKELFGQLEQIIELNEKELNETIVDFRQRCIHAASAVAFVVEKSSDLIYDLEETRKLATELDVDEIHYIDNKGYIFAGTHPEYYGFNFDSGEQMAYFKPMLADKSLKMCQDIMANTAENKYMQYAAVWLDNKEIIVEIGMEPRRLYSEMAEKDFQKIISNMPFELNGYLHIVDMNTAKIVASSMENLKGESVEVGDNEITKDDIMYYHYQFNGKKFCVFSKVYDDYLLIRTYDSYSIINRIFFTSLYMIIFTLTGAFIILWLIRWYLKKYIISNIDYVNNQLKKIEEGDLDDIDANTKVKELDEMLVYVNKMLNSIRLNWDKFSYVINKSGTPIGIYESNNFYKHNYYNDKLLEILDIKDKDITNQEIENIICDILKNPKDLNEHIYIYKTHSKVKYLYIEIMEDIQSKIYYVSDMSYWWNEVNIIKEQSENDDLTNLLNRRGFIARLEYLFKNRHLIKNAAMIMIDADNLKYINDTLGHYKGDEYIINLSTNLKKAINKNSLCARLGGDEFSIFLYGFSNIQDLNKTIKKIADIRGTKLNDDGFTLEFSIGVAYYERDSSDFYSLIRIADMNMYQEKNNRKNKLDK